MIWLMLTNGACELRFIRAEAPCWKGEINIPLYRWSLTLGWHKSRIPADSSNAKEG